MLESKIQKTVVDHAKRWGMFTHKMEKDRGAPDYMFLYCSTVFFIEFKAPNQRPRKYQEYMHDRIRKQGFEVYVIDNIAKGLQLIEDIVRENLSK